MADVDGTYECVVKSPLGDQKMTTTIRTEGNTFTGNSAGAMGSMDISGNVDGNTLTWKQSITVPMPMTLDCEATVDGDVIVGTVGAGAFGSFPMSGKRV
jgi:hypothetical protein